MSKTTNTFSPEVRERAVRMVSEHRADHRSEWDAMVSIAGKIGCTAETLRRWCRDEAGRRAGPAAMADDDRTRLKAARAGREGASPSQRDPQEGVGKFCDGGARPPRAMTMPVPSSVEGAFIDAHREELGIEPICRKMAVAPSSYHQHAARRTDPGKRPARARLDDEMKRHIRRVHEASVGLYGSRKVWRQLLRDGVTIAKCTVERWMRAMGLAGVRRGKSCVTTVPDRKALCPLDMVNREFKVQRPNALWLVDCTYVHSWAGFIYAAFVIDAFARRMVGWKVSSSATASFVLDALEQAIHARRPTASDGCIHHSDQGSQYTSENFSG